MMTDLHQMQFQIDRAQGALFGLAIGDALGMPSQTLPRDVIQSKYGTINDFIAPFEGHPVSHGLLPAQVTDDTEQALLLAQRVLAEPGSFNPADWAQDLLEWEADVRRRGLRDLLGPSTKAALSAIEQGAEPGEAARHGTTNGAAMRICPVGIAVSSERFEHLIDTVEMTSRVTHNTGEAISGAAAVAAAISAQIDGAALDDALKFALEAAEAGQTRGYPSGVSDMRARISRALDLATDPVSTEELATSLGNSVASHHSVPAAFAIARLADGNVWEAALIAANFGDDTDTIGAIAGAICGAGTGIGGIPAAKRDALVAANELDIANMAEKLIAMRHLGSETQRMAAMQ